MSDFAFARPTRIDMTAQGFGDVKYGDDSLSLVQFRMHSVHNPLKSQQQGLPVYDDIPFVRIQQPGENNQVIDRPVQENDKRRWPHQWRQFEANRDAEQEQDGVPIELLYPGSPAAAAMLRGAGICTIEACANMSANALDTVGMGAQDHKNRAAAFLDIGRGGAGYHKLKKENDDLRMSVAKLERQMGEMRNSYEQLYQNTQGQQRNLLPDPEAMIPTRQPYQQMQRPQVMQGAVDALNPPEVKLDKSHMAPPKTGKLRKPWDNKEDAA